jgi:beta-xylosidase
MHADEQRPDDQSGSCDEAVPVWRDVSRSVDDRVADLLSRMTLEEKLGQLYGVWVGAEQSGEGVAPHQHELSDPNLDFAELVTSGLGQLTRPFGTAPVDPAAGVRSLAATQRQIMAAGRFGIPAIAHEECLTGFMTWQATVFPTPLAWGASFNPDLVERMAASIGASMRRVGAHQGLAPVLDVTRDLRWGRTEETIGEDPYLVGTIGTAYVRGLQSAGIIATPKHFVGYSASRAGRNFGPVSVGPRELADIFLVPFEMAIREGGAKSIMHAYTAIDGVPTAADASLLTELLREQWGFAGTVVADYFGISFLERLHEVAADPADAAVLALQAGVDVELPTVRCYRQPLAEAVRQGRVDEAIVDRAVTRVLRQKCELGMLDPGWDPVPEGFVERPTSDAEQRTEIDLDPPHARNLARRLAEQSVILLRNEQVLPIAPGPATSIGVVGPVADDPLAMLGCYAFPSHVGPQHPDVPTGIEIPTLLQALQEAGAWDAVRHAPGCSVEGEDRSGFAAAVEVAKSVDVCVVAVGDRAGLFGRGTSGEGCDATELRLPGVQEELVEELLQTGRPVVLVVLSGRPYALGRFVDRAHAIVQAFFPGQEGARAIAGVLTGRVCPSGRLPVSVPRHPGGQPATYLTTKLGKRSKLSSVDSTPLYPFGYGLSYTQFTWSDVRADGTPLTPDHVVELPPDGSVQVSLQVRNDGDRRGADVVQLYLHDPVAEVAQPVVRLVGYARIELDPGSSGEVCFDVAADLASFTGRDGIRIIEPGELELRLSTSSEDARFVVPVRIVGSRREVGHRRQLTSRVTVRQ